jgi:hypothetical protein
MRPFIPKIQRHRRDGYKKEKCFQSVLAPTGLNGSIPRTWCVSRSGSSSLLLFATPWGRVYWRPVAMAYSNRIWIVTAHNCSFQHGRWCILQSVSLDQASVKALCTSRHRSIVLVDNRCNGILISRSNHDSKVGSTYGSLRMVR